MEEGNEAEPFSMSTIPIETLWEDISTISFSKNGKILIISTVNNSYILINLYGNNLYKGIQSQKVVTTAIPWELSLSPWSRYGILLDEK